MRLKPIQRKMDLRAIDQPIDRCEGLQTLTLERAVEWVKTKKPLLWIGSIFSVPQPSGLPAGAAVTRVMLDLIYPPYDKRISPSLRDRGIEGLNGFALEQLMDYLEVLVDPQFPEMVIGQFDRLNSEARPNSLHDAVVKYYALGLSSAPFCITTNWDTLLERAFRAHGYSARVSGPGRDICEVFGSGKSEEKTLFIYHPHGSFETRDTVSSAYQEQQQLPMPYDYLNQPVLFLGYSGYEPSMYPHLDRRNPQLWCIRDKEEALRNPAKRRLLCKPNTHVFVGDICELLRSLRVLDTGVVIPQVELALERPDLDFDSVRKQIGAVLDASVASELLLDTQLLFDSDSNAGMKTFMTMRAIDGHIRNRVRDFKLPLALMAARFYPFQEQIWISLIGYLLRHSQDERQISWALRQIDMEQRPTGLLEDARIMRLECYKKFFGILETTRDDDELYLAYALIAQGRAGDMALGGELSELAGFHCLRDGDDNRARAYFDSAATYYYLTGLWRGGERLEWASKTSLK